MERELYISKVSSELGIGIEAIYAEINKRIFGNSNKVAKVTHKVIESSFNKPSEDEVPSKVYNAEKLLIYLLCQNENKIYKEIKKYIDFENFKVNLYKKLAEKLFRYFEGEKLQNIIDLFSDDEEINVITGIMQEDFNFGNNNEKALNDALDIITKFDLEKEKSEILKSIKAGANDLDLEVLERRLNDVIRKLHSGLAERRK
jgi:hypothetical protein